MQKILIIFYAEKFLQMDHIIILSGSQSTVFTLCKNSDQNFIQCNNNAEVHGVKRKKKEVRGCNMKNNFIFYIYTNFHGRSLNN